MLEYIIEAAKNFSRHQLEYASDEVDQLPQMRTFIAYIDVTDSHQKAYRIYTAYEAELMQQIANVYLFEEESDEETLREMTLEVANMIVGSAKVLSEEDGKNPFTISTPHFVKNDIFDIECDKKQTLKVDGKIMHIAIKEL